MYYVECSVYYYTTVRILIEHSVYCVECSCTVWYTYWTRDLMWLAVNCVTRHFERSGVLYWTFIILRISNVWPTLCERLNRPKNLKILLWTILTFPLILNKAYLTLFNILRYYKVCRNSSNGLKQSVGVCAVFERAEIAQIHLFGDEKPHFVVVWHKRFTVAVHKAHGDSTNGLWRHVWWLVVTSLSRIDKSVPFRPNSRFTFLEFGPRKYEKRLTEHEEAGDGVRMTGIIKSLEENSKKH